MSNGIGNTPVLIQKSDDKLFVKIGDGDVISIINDSWPPFGWVAIRERKLFRIPPTMRFRHRVKDAYRDYAFLDFSNFDEVKKSLLVL